MDIQQLEKYKRKIEEAKASKARAEGVMESLMKQLSEFGCSTIEEANEKIKQYSSTIEKLQSDFDRNMMELHKLIGN